MNPYHLDDINRQFKFYMKHGLNYSISLKEIERFWWYLKDPTLENKQLWIAERLRREARKYEDKGIPRNKWPKGLQGINTHDKSWR